MDSNKSLFLVIAIAILGGIVFSQFADIPPAVAFVLGCSSHIFRC